MEKNLYIDASHPEETRVVLKSKTFIEEYESENKNNLSLKNKVEIPPIEKIKIMSRKIIDRLNTLIRFTF